jgi:polygalacturonase
MHARWKIIFKLLPVVIFVLTASAVTTAPGKTVDATKTGAIGDGATVNTAAIQKAIDDCSADGGGTIQFPAGRFVTGTIQLKDNVTLRLDENAVLLGSTNAADYRNVDPFMAGDGVPLGYALIVAEDAHAMSASKARARLTDKAKN